MSLSAREQQALNAIEERLTGSDPKLASLLAMFSRLTSGEEMPVREKVRAGWRRATRRRPARRRHPPRGGAWRPVRQVYLRLGWQRAVLLLWLLTAIALIAAALAINGGDGKGQCTQPMTASCISGPPAHSAA